ncbi:hypothetical protein ACLIBH_07525 [Virgibacillus sp. W0430]|uniref:hypothetical protein n=1 Tax=Virgibacillus sp. W0430 TaxID=3391580 RepID=UPI003F48B6D5
MNDKYAKEIAKELRLIRIELQKITEPNEQRAEYDRFGTPITDTNKAGDQVTIG